MIHDRDSGNQSCFFFFSTQRVPWRKILSWIDILIVLYRQHYDINQPNCIWLLRLRILSRRVFRAHITRTFNLTEKVERANYFYCEIYIRNRGTFDILATNLCMTFESGGICFLNQLECFWDSEMIAYFLINILIILLKNYAHSYDF